MAKEIIFWRNFSFEIQMNRNDQTENLHCGFIYLVTCFNRISYGMPFAAPRTCNFRCATRTIAKLAALTSTSTQVQFTIFGSSECHFSLKHWHIHAIRFYELFTFYERVFLFFTCASSHWPKVHNDNSIIMSREKKKLVTAPVIRRRVHQPNIFDINLILYGVRSVEPKRVEAEHRNIWVHATLSPLLVPTNIVCWSLMEWAIKCFSFDARRYSASLNLNRINLCSIRVTFLLRNDALAVRRRPSGHAHCTMCALRLRCILNSLLPHFFSLFSLFCGTGWR